MIFFRPHILCFLFAAIILVPGTARGNDDSASFNNLLGKDDACLLAAPDGHLLVAVRIDQPLVPASTLKILTALTAYYYLGQDHRFTTEFYLDNTGNLKIKGFGDPLLISEVIVEMASAVQRRLASRSIRINDVVLDTSFFADSLTIPGVTDTLNPYDAPNGALCANFNTVSFKRLKNGTTISDEPQTPLLPSVLPRIRASKLKEGRIMLSNQKDEAALYFGELFQYFLKQKGGIVTGRVRLGKIDPLNDTPLLSYVSSFSLDETVAKLMAYSNNFIANQLLIAAGAKAFGAPGTLAKGVAAAQAFAKTKLGIQQLQLAEGSGISRDNRISARTMSRLLKAFLPHHHLLWETDHAYYKTGTLIGVSTRAGYIKGAEGALYPFVVIINTPGKSADRVMDRLRKRAVK
ncbi:MAG: D-alanyl-D-alanine carboxypeptidase [Desulfobacterales bacterium]|nr:D-alanyl-D-alanine carboxypeptidase [Desulfobacterales bacterium]